ncbi:hypothetical protein LK540_23780 [Massilia sp. IC2-278]|uniref:hypothetical protein n=1 Tax=Massilia sp. IC2-278 TaxID=2887200 RepID=UPI001E459D6B|nr:hypothetical protein [Massilia sp. IC2-278]MCC2963463.1 hypothetical protein [Massilia sp. IC2-278]
MSAIGWIHPTDDSDQWDGFNEPGIEHFSGSPIRHLAREVVQNSLDSYDEVIGKAVKVTINEVNIKTSQIPGLEQLIETFQLCLISAENESPKAKQFFELGLKELERPKIKVLEISDFNTKGIRGPAKNGAPYYAFMKAKGQSKKSSETAGGSFGIGKFAPYAVSRLRTVFVSTVFKSENGEVQQLSQGKSILMSHDDKEGRRHQGIGFWGVKEKCQPVENQSDDIPQWLSRASNSDEISKKVGTKLIILGFESQTGWQQSLAASIAENFFGAINTGRLEVSIDKKYVINSNGISEIFANQEIVNAIVNEKNEPEQFKNSSEYYTCLTSHEDVFIEQHQNLHLGLCELKILVREGLSKKVAFLRNGMFISDSLTLPGLKNFSEFKDFVAVFQCKDDKGLELLRSMEPPRHDDFEPDRLPTKDEQGKARRALKEMATWIREMLRRRAKDPVSEITKIDELKDFFADEADEGKGNGLEEKNPFGKILIKAKPVSFKPSKSIVSEGGATDTGGAANDSEKGKLKNSKAGEESPGIPGGDGSVRGGGTIKPVAPLANPRAVVISKNTRRISFTPLADGKYELSLFEVGADSDYQIAIEKSSAGKIHSGKLEVDVEKGNRQSLDIQFTEDFDGALKVVAHEI